MRVLLLAGLWTVVCAQYVPEPYGWACFQMAAKRDWPVCSSVSRTQKRQCLCEIPEFVSLTESCLLKAVVNATDPEFARTTARRESLCVLNDVPLSVSQATLKKPSGYTSVQEMEYVDPIDLEDIKMAILTAEWRMTNDRRATRSGVILVAYWGLILIVRYVASIMNAMLPRSWVHYIMTRSKIKKLRARYFNSPLGHQRHCEPCLGFLGIRLPTRIMSIFILVFIAVNYILIFTGFPYEDANFIYTTPNQQYNKSLAIRAAFMIMWKLPLLVCFAGRNNIFMLLRHPWSLDAFSVLHKWIARITVLDIVIHSVAISLVKAEQGFYGIVWKVEYWQWGVVGTITTCLIAFQSMYWISRYNYDAFVVIHIVLGVVFFIASWYHVYTLPYGKYHVIATIAIWVFDRVSRLARIAMAGRVKGYLRHCDAHVTIISIKAPRLYRLQQGYSGNSYVFLHVSCWYLFWQSHPFTIVEKGFKTTRPTEDSIETKTLRKNIRETVTRVDTHVSRISQFTQEVKPTDQDCELMICIKQRRGITKYISRLPEGPINVAIDGPYGYSHPLHKFCKVLFFAGGIGITPVMGYVKRVIDRRRHQETEIQIHWAVSELASMRWAIEELTDVSKSIKLTIYVSGQEKGSEITADFARQVVFIYQRLKCMEVIKTELTLSNANQGELSHINTTQSTTVENAFNDSEANTLTTEKQQSLAIFSCGPDKLNDEVRIAACWAIENSKFYVDYYEESFSW